MNADNDATPVTPGQADAADRESEGQQQPEEGAALSAKETIRSCLNRLLRVALNDGRTIEGMLECYDNHANMVLTDATDVSSKGTRPFGRSIRLGTVLVPGGAAENVLAWREKYADTGELVRREPEEPPVDHVEPAVGEDSDDEFAVVTEGFDGLHVGL